MPWLRGKAHPNYRLDIVAEEAKRLHCQESLSASEIAEIFNCDPQTIRRRLKATGSLRTRCRRLDIGDEALLESYTSGKGVVELSREFHCRHITISKRLHGLGIENIRRASMLGEKNPSWRGGRYRTGGYIYVYKPAHPYATKYGYVMEHRLVLEQKLGRYLLFDEVGHHINGKRNDNRPENLVALSRKGHPHLTLLKIAQERIRELELGVAQRG